MNIGLQDIFLGGVALCLLLITGVIVGLLFFLMNKKMKEGRKNDRQDHP